MSFTRAKDYRDFHLHLEALINDRGSAGVSFRAAFDPSDPMPKNVHLPRWLNSNCEKPISEPAT